MRPPPGEASRRVSSSGRSPRCALPPGRLRRGGRRRRVRRGSSSAAMLQRVVAVVRDRVEGIAAPEVDAEASRRVVPAPRRDNPAGRRGSAERLGMTLRPRTRPGGLGHDGRPMPRSLSARTGAAGGDHAAARHARHDVAGSGEIVRPPKSVRKPRGDRSSRERSAAAARSGCATASRSGRRRSCLPAAGPWR